tara:strand:+ start:463 stop:1095 length:633 start_codon:yes stop_codon:yes gene_type:complete
MNLSIKPTSELNYQAQQQLEDLNNRLNPYLEQYDNCRNSIVETYRNWKTSANKSAIEYAEPFIEEIGISKGYLSKLNQIDKFKSNFKRLGWYDDDFLDWFDSHGTEKCYLLCKAGLDKASELHMSNQKVSLRNLKEYIKAKSEETKEETLTIPNDEDLLNRVKQRLDQDIGLDVSPFASRLRELIIQKMEEREKQKRLQQLKLLTPTTTN